MEFSEFPKKVRCRKHLISKPILMNFPSDLEVLCYMGGPFGPNGLPFFEHRPGPGNSRPAAPGGGGAGR